jgi:hypothetical protein
LWLATTIDGAVETAEARDAHPTRNRNVDRTIRREHAGAYQDRVTERQRDFKAEANESVPNGDGPKTRNAAAPARYFANLTVEGTAQEKELEPSGSARRERKPGCSPSLADAKQVRQRWRKGSQAQE